MIKIAIADDQILLAQSLKLILESDPELKVVAIGKNGKEALKICKDYKPDILLIDINMPELSGIEATKLIKENYENLKVIMLTTFENLENIMESFTAGADGYLVKDLSPEDLKLAVKCTFRGLHIIHNSVHKAVINEFSKALRKNMKLRNNNFDLSLSATEIEIIKLVSQGHSNKEISDLLCFAEGTIKNKISNLLGKLELRDRTQIAIFAIENNIV